MKRSEFFKGAAASLGTLTLARNLPSAPLRRLFSGPEAPEGEALWRVVRDQFILHPDWTYLNFGGLGSMPLPVLKSYEDWSRVEERAPGAGFDQNIWNATKDKLARILGPSCRREDLAFISSTTEGINMILNGLALKRGDEVITSSHEHIAMKAALLNRMKRDGIVFRIFNPDLKKGLGNLDRIASLVNSRTRLIFLSHVTCTYGQVLPVKEIAALARSKGLWFALDGAQGPACVPFDIVDIGVDFYTSSTHKWMMAPKRTGFLFVRNGMLDALQPLTVGAGSAQTADPETKEFVFNPSAARFEYGTQNEALYFALGTAIDFLGDIGISRVQAYSRGLSEKFYSGLKELPGAEILSPEEEVFRSPMITFKMARHDYQEILKRLTEDHIRVRQVNEGGLDCVRVSFYINNAPEDVEKIINSLKKLVG